MGQFNWSEVPKNRQGMVDYRAIASMQVRLMIAKAEHTVLDQELKAREQWTPSSSNEQRLRLIKQRLEWLEQEYLSEEVC